MLRTMYELERLGEKLDVDQPAAAEFHVTAAGRLLAELQLHPPPDRDDVFNQGEPSQGSPAPSFEVGVGQRRAVDEPPKRRAHAARETVIAENHARAYH